MSNDDVFFGAKGFGGFGFVADGKPMQEDLTQDVLTEAFADIEEYMTAIELIEQLVEKVDRIERKLDLIFGEHVVINGRLVDIGKVK